MSLFTDLLASSSAQRRFLAILEPYDPAAAATTAIYLSSDGFNSAPADSPASTHFEARIVTPASLTRSLFEATRLSGRAIPAAGNLVLNNQDGALDGLADYSWGGRRVRLYLGGAGFALADYGLIYDGTAQGVEASEAEITVVLRDYSYLFDKELQDAKYAGTGGAGGSSDLKDRLKVRTYGSCYAVEPLYLGISGGKHVFAVNDGPIVGVSTLWDAGIKLTPVPSSPAAGEWSYNAATGIVTLGGSYVGPIICDVIGTRYLSQTSSTSRSIPTTFPSGRPLTMDGALDVPVGATVRVARTSDIAGTYMDGTVVSNSGTAISVSVTSASGSGAYSDWTIMPWGTTAGILKAIAADLGATTFDTPALQALDTAQPATVGFFVSEGGNGFELLDFVAGGASAHYGFTRDGAFTAGRIDAPAGPIASYDTTQILELTRERAEDPDWEVAVQYQRVWRVHGGNEFAGSAGDPFRAFLLAEWRQVLATDTGILTAYLLADRLVLESTLAEAASAATEAARLLALYGVRRKVYKARLKTQALAHDLGDCVTVAYDRYGLSAGGDFRVIGIEEDLAAAETALWLWG